MTCFNTFHKESLPKRLNSNFTCLQFSVTFCYGQLISFFCQQLLELRFYKGNLQTKFLTRQDHLTSRSDAIHSDLVEIGSQTISHGVLEQIKELRQTQVSRNERYLVSL